MIFKKDRFLVLCKTMKAWIIDRFGDSHVFKQADLPVPQLLPNNVLIRVAATSINPVDYKIRAGVVADIAPDFPALLHGDVAGVIEAVGAGVDNFKIGDEVYGCVGGVRGLGGALAEYMLADVNLMARKPNSLTMIETAALPLVSITAWEGLIDRAQVQPGQKVLVYGATGGVGHIGVQLAKWAGATVYGLVSNDEKAAIARKLGADFTINYRQQSVEAFVEEYTKGRGFDVVFDTVGNDNLQNAFRAAKLNGTVVSTVALSSQDLTLLHGKGLTLHLVYMLIPLLYKSDRASHGKILSRLSRLVDDGYVRPLLAPKVFSITDITAAHHYAESGRGIGKVVVSW